MLLLSLVKEKRKEKEILSNYELFLFGSYMDNPKEANDIDLLIVYDKKNLSIDKILDERKSLKEIIHSELNLPVEVCILNREEYEDDDMMKYIKKKELK